MAVSGQTSDIFRQPFKTIFDSFCDFSARLFKIETEEM